MEAGPSDTVMHPRQPEDTFVTAILWNWRYLHPFSPRILNLWHSLSPTLERHSKLSKKLKANLNSPARNPTETLKTVFAGTWSITCLTAKLIMFLQIFTTIAKKELQQRSRKCADSDQTSWISVKKETIMQMKEFKITTESACMQLAYELLAITIDTAFKPYPAQPHPPFHYILIAFANCSVWSTFFPAILSATHNARRCGMQQQPCKTNTSPHSVRQTRTQHQPLLHTRHFAAAFATCATAVSLA